MTVATSFSQLYLCIQPPLHSPSKICSPTSVSFHLPISPLLVNKIVLKILLQHAFSLYLSSFSSPYFCVQSSQQSTSKIFSISQLFSQFKLSILISTCFLKVWTVITGLTITDSLSLMLRKLVY